MTNLDDVQRDVPSHILSGTVFSAIFAGSINYNKYKKKEITKQEAVQDTLKLATQGGIGTGCAIATANSFYKGDYTNGLLAILIGSIGVYSVEKASEAITKGIKKKEDTKLEKWIKNDKQVGSNEK